MFEMGDDAFGIVLIIFFFSFIVLMFSGILYSEIVSTTQTEEGNSDDRENTE